MPLVPHVRIRLPAALSSRGAVTVALLVVVGLAGTAVAVGPPGSGHRRAADPAQPAGEIEPHADPDPASAPQFQPPPAPPGLPAEVPPAARATDPDAPAELPRHDLARVEPRLAAFAGLSTWIDLYDTGLTPEEQVAAAHTGGVQTIFVQAARHTSPADIHDPARLGRVIELAHDRGIRVMTWYIPDHVDWRRDLRRAQAAINFTTARGDRPDAFGLDIELEDVADVPERSRRLLALSRALREWTGPEFPMAAIVLPPLQLDLRPSWWPDFPYAELTSYYDVFIPMSYSSFRGADIETTYRWNLDNIAELRVRAGSDALPVHLAGGIADALPEVEAFTAAARDGRAIGGGLYDLHTTPPQSWRALRALRVEAAVP